MSLRITKIKHDRKAKKVQIEYYQENTETSDDIFIQLSSQDDPLDSFDACLNMLAPHVERICQFEQGYCNMAEVRSVSISHTNNVMGAVITCLVPIDTSYSPVVINTPHLPSSAYSEGSEAPLLPSECTKIIKQLIKEAEKYIAGERKPSNQTELELT